MAAVWLDGLLPSLLERRERACLVRLHIVPLIAEDAGANSLKVIHLTVLYIWLALGQD